MTDFSADIWKIAGPGLTARISADGAELQSLQDGEGREMLWQAGPAWPRHAPVLFPIVGRLRDDQLNHAGRSHRMTQHGFARDSRFAWESQMPDSCRLVLTDSEATHAAFPFPFHLEIGYGVADGTLVMDAHVTNPGSDTLPAALGTHPAFRWPLADGLEKSLHRLEFAKAEAAPVRRLEGGLLKPETFPTPIDGRTLSLTESLFAADALILDQPASRSVQYLAPGAPRIALSWVGFTELGLWSRPGADFLCIEPWHGFASPQDFDGDFVDKPGLMLIPPGATRSFRLTIRLLPAA